MDRETMADKKNTEQFYTRPPKLGKWESFKIFLWNSETNQFLGRTGSSWGKIILFYLLFYAALIGFFAAMLTVFYQTLDAKQPKWKLESSLIGSNPGLGFRPMPPDDNVESTLVWYKSSDHNNVAYWVNELNKFLNTYETTKEDHPNNYQECSQGVPPMQGKVCQMDKIRQVCLPENNFNYDSLDGGPCIFLKLNKIFDWVPEYYTSENLPDKMPDDLKEHIRKENGSKNANTVWVSCEGESPADIENIGPRNYLPSRGFPGQFFPFKNDLGYVSPYVAVHFEKPRRHVLINIECKAWAVNVIHDRADRRGSVHFELMVD